jgi:Zn-dependent protease
LDIIDSILVWLIPLVVAIVLHEMSHGLVANMLGDRTAAEAGRLSFNPIRHIDPVGTVILPLVLVLASAPVFGWAKPVPVDGKRLRNPRLDMVLVALAGPMMNLFLGVLAVGGLGLLVWSLDGGEPNALASFIAVNLGNFLMINIFLAVFNLLPLPPFDGGHVVEGLLPRNLAVQYARLAPFGFPIMLVLLVVLPSISPEANFVARVIGPIVQGIVRFLLWTVGITD